MNFETNEDTLTGLLNILTDRLKKDIDNRLPCVVTAVSDDRTRVSVVPQIRLIDRAGKPQNRSEIEGLTVFTGGAGNFLISFNVSVGDIGWIEASDRDISLFLQSYEESNPGSRRKHSFSDAKFMPDIMTNYTIAEEDASALVVQNRAGTVKIAMDDEIRITKDEVTFVISGDTVVGSAPGGYTLNGAKITPGGDVVTASGVSLDNHPHDQSNDSGGNTEQPTNAPTATE